MGAQHSHENEIADDKFLRPLAPRKKGDFETKLTGGRSNGIARN